MSYFCSSRCVAKLCRNVCGVTQLGNPACSAAMWQARLSWRVVIGLTRSRPGNIHTWGCAMRHQSRSNSNNVGDGMAWRSLWPLPCSTRSIMRLESISQTFSATTSMARRAVRGKLRIFEPQLIDREFGFGLARIDWRRLVDFCDRTSHEQSLADEFCKAQIENFQGIQTLREAQEQIGDHRGDDLQADSVAVVADELTKIEMLLDPAEQQFNLPAPLVEGRNLDCGAFEIVGDEGDGPALITLDLDASQRDRQLGIALAGEHDIIISDDNVVLASNHESKVAIALPQINVQLDKCCATYLNTIDC